MTRPTTINAITEIPANTPRPIGRTESVFPGSSNAAAVSEGSSAAAAEAPETAASDAGVPETSGVGVTDPAWLKVALV